MDGEVEPEARSLRPELERRSRGGATRALVAGVASVVAPEERHERFVVASQAMDSLGRIVSHLLVQHGQRRAALVQKPPVSRAARIRRRWARHGTSRRCWPRPRPSTRSAQRCLAEHTDGVKAPVVELGSRSRRQTPEVTKSVTMSRSPWRAGHTRQARPR
jgi:hypothetical protein